MPKFNSKVSVFKITDTSSVLQNLSTYLTEISGLPGERETNDSTTIGDDGRERLPSLENAVVRIAGFFDDTADTGPDDVLGDLLTHTSATAFEYYPKGTGGIKYSGDCWVRRYELTTRVGEIVGFTCELEVDGQIGRA